MAGIQATRKFESGRGLILSERRPAVLVVVWSQGMERWRKRGCGRGYNSRLKATSRNASNEER